jgi:hypothetical protein
MSKNTEKTEPDREMVVNALFLARQKLEFAEEHVREAMDYADGITNNALAEIRERLLKVINDVNTLIDGLEVD